MYISEVALVIFISILYIAVHLCYCICTTAAFYRCPGVSFYLFSFLLLYYSEKETISSPVCAAHVVNNKQHNKIFGSFLGLNLKK